jgi:hypothetical protein
MKKGYYSRGDTLEVHMFKTQLIDKETHTREDHAYLVNKKAVALRRPRNVLLAEPTPRSRPGTHNISAAPRHEQSGTLANPNIGWNRVGGSMQTAYPVSPISGSSSSLRAPGGATLYDLAYTSAVARMRRQANAKLASLGALQKLHALVDAEVQPSLKERTLEHLTTDAWIKSETGVVSGLSK